jgi:adhesin transport system outer membrane protein
LRIRRSALLLSFSVIAAALPAPSFGAERQSAAVAACPDCPPGRKVKRTGAVSASPDNLPDAVRRALASHPQMAIARSRLAEGTAGLDAARSGRLPQIDLRLAGGAGALGTNADFLTDDVYGRKRSIGGARVEAQLSARQLVYDFGARSGQIASADAKRRSAERVISDVGEEIAHRTADAYLRVLETRAILTVAEENVAALDRLRMLIEENEKNGNSTTADVNRIRAKLSDASSIASDARSEAANATDGFRRLVRVEPGPLREASMPSAFLPRSVDDALGRLTRSNPKLLALAATADAARRDAEAQRASDLPLVTLDAELTQSSRSGHRRQDELDGRLMLTMRKNLFDGGLASSQLRQAIERAEQAELQHRFAFEEAEADLRQAYRAISGAREKYEGLRLGVESSAKARELYDEQFAGGKRTLFELLDIQAAYFTARRSQISNRFEEHRAVFSVLRTLGRLSAALLEPKPVPAALEKAEPSSTVASPSPTGGTPARIRRSD